jgi:hypothetical protein
MIDDLRAEYELLYGAKPHHKLSEKSLIEAIEAKKNEKPEEKPGSKDQEVNKKTELPEKIDSEDEITKQFEEAEREISKVLDGKRHLVYRDGKEIWWRASVIEVFLQRNGAESLTFPENTQYITTKEIKRCTSCG